MWAVEFSVLPETPIQKSSSLSHYLSQLFYDESINLIRMLAYFWNHILLNFFHATNQRPLEPIKTINGDQLF